MILPLSLNKESGIPLYVQLEEQIRHLIHNGTLRAGQPMPTVRALAVELGINSNTIGRVYRDLQQLGFLELKRGIGTFVSSKAAITPITTQERLELERRVDELIALSSRLRMNSVELAQLIETRWKEASKC